jgi:oligopeptide transport system ATP-binding protein
MDPLIQVNNIKKHFLIERPSIFNILSKKKSFVYAVDGVSFNINGGETYGLVGESGSGKTTIGRLVLKLIEPTSGNIFFKGEPIQSFDKKHMKQYHREAQIIFQDPFASLDPRMTVRRIIGEALDIHELAKGEEKWNIVMDLLEKVGLSPANQYIDRYPHEFSGGQKQRICIARALSVSPKFIVADEPVSALDMSVRATILNLMQKLQKDLGLTYLFISHDLAVIRHMSDRIGIIYLGKKVEELEARDLMKACHPYTQALLSVFPRIDLTVKKSSIHIKGEIPSSINPPKGCRFHTRCLYTEDVCKIKEPEYIEETKDHFVACHLFT